LNSVKTYPDRVCIYHQDKLIARHVRRYDRHQDYEDPDHPKALLAQRHNAREQRLLKQFLSLSRHAPVYVEGIEQRRVNPRHHLRKIVALSEIYGVDAVDRAFQLSGRVLRMRLDWIAVRGFTAKGRPVTLPAAGRDGRPLSDHAAIGVDLAASWGP
jgi:hypothetical protein